MSHGPGPGGGGPGRGRVAPGQKSKNFGKSFKRLVRELGPEKWLISLALLASLAGVILNVIAPKIMGNATDIIFNGVISKQLPPGATKEAAIAGLKAQGQEKIADMLSGMDIHPGQGIDFSGLTKVLLWVALIYIGSAIVSYISGYLLRTVVQNTGYRLRNQIQDKIERLPLKYFDTNSRGDLMSRVSNDVDNATQVMNQTMSQFFQSILTLIGIMAMMLTLSWKLTLAALLVVPVGAVIAGVLMKKAQPQFREQWRSTGAVSGVVEEAMTGHEVVALYGLEKRYTDQFNEANTDLYNSSFKAQFISNLVMPIMTLISNTSFVIVAVGGGLMVTNGSMTLGSVQAFIQYSRQFTQPLGQLASMANSLQSGIASAERVFEFLDADEMAYDDGAKSFAEARERTEHPERTGAEQPDALARLAAGKVGAAKAHAAANRGPERVKGAIDFRDVKFSYVPGKPIIKGLTLDVEPGQMVAIIGPTGAGKTTLVNLLERFYELDSGQILIDGVDITDLNKDTLRDHMGMVLQDTWLFDGTITENIAFGREGATEDEVVAAAKATGSDRLIRQLPEGYDTPISDEGDQVSVGERQLLTIARAFVSQPDILILDEATSSVDTRTEVLVQQAMDQLREGRTAFVIAHRLSTIRDADLILVMEDGDVVETGKHDDLLAKGGAYAKLYNAQFATPEDKDGDGVADDDPNLTLE